MANKQITNILAEFTGHKMGLEAARDMKIREITDVGDSALILGQMKDYRPPKKEPLRSLYTQARRIAYQIHIHQWTCHHRQYNKMADVLANQAINSRASA